MAQSAAHKHDSTRRATYQDVLDAPAHQVAEIIDHARIRSSARKTRSGVHPSRELGTGNSRYESDQGDFIMSSALRDDFRSTARER